MRTWLLIFGTIGAIAVLTGVYVFLQPTSNTPPSVFQELAKTAPPPAPEPSTNPAESPVHGGENVWVKVFDEKTKQLAWQFRAAQHDPHPDNTDYLTQPEAEFFFNNGQMVHLEGSHGRVVMSGSTARHSDMGGPPATPSRGELYDVTIKLYENADQATPSLVCTMNNVAFDNDTFRIATQAFKQDDGTVVPADMVPVKIRGEQYDFDGKGMTIRWDDRDRRLQSLEIAHGDELTIKQGLDEKGTGQAATPATVIQKQPAPKSAKAKPKIEKTESNPANVETAIAATTEPTTKPHRPPPVYRATFDGGVNITQGDQQVAQADVMNVEFMSEQQGDNSSPTTAPAKTTAAKKPASPTTQRTSPLAANSTRKSTTAPTTQPQEPIVIHWPGKLVVVPIEENIPKLEPGQRNVEMVSAATPVTLHHNGSDVTCASFFYGGADDSLIVRSSPQVPLITMKNPDGALVYTPSLKYDGSSGRADLDGPSRAEIPIQNNQTNTKQTLKAQWSQSCVMNMTGPSPDEMTIQNADIVGDVSIDHPQLKLQSQTLHTDFAPDQTKKGSSQLTQLIAGGNVVCDLTDQDQKQQHITSQYLQVATTQSSTGQLVPQQMIADGKVHSFNDEQDLHAEHLMAKFAPTTRPTDQPQIQTLFAQQDVTFEMKDKNASGKCDQLQAVADGDDFNVKLSGQPSATVTSGDSTLTGPIINMQPKRQVVQVVGAGSMHGTQQQQNSAAKPTPFDMSWSNGLNFDGTNNHADADANIVIVSTSSDGAVNTATGDKVTMELMDDPHATTKPAVKTPATKPGNSLVSGFDSGQKKAVKTMTLSNNVEVKSVLSDAHGQPLRRMHLFTDEVHADNITHQFTTPKGRMLYEDRRPSTKPSTTEPANSQASPMGDMSGATAFQWDQSLNFDQTQNRAQMLGNVLVVHQDNSSNIDPFRLEAHQVSAYFEKADKTDKTDAAMMPDASDQKLKLLTADDNVRFSSKQTQFNSEHMTYDPSSELLTATGSENNPVQLFDDKGVSLGYFQQVMWNTQTQQISLRDVQVQYRK